MIIKPRAHIAVAAAFFIYVLLIRTYNLANSFLMLGEQTRDWAVALGSWTDLPLTGAPSTAGGRGFGPAYYWILWIGRVLVGPFASNLPHAGGIWIALLQSVADTWLLVVLARRVPLVLALAMCLFIASAPFDISISGVIWNPPVAAALVKMATALALSLGESPAAWRVAITAAVSWLAVQAHLSAIFVAAPLITALVAQPLLRRQWRHAARFAAAIAVVIVVLQIPYVIVRLREPEAAAGPTTALSAMTQAESLQVAKSYGTVVNSTGELLVRQMDTWHFQWPFLAVALVVLVRWRKDLPLLAVTVGPIVGATILFSTWTRSYDSYWFLTATTAMVMTFGLALAAIPWIVAVQGAGAVVLAAVMAWQPARLAASRDFFSYPPYGTMRIGSIELARIAPVLRDIRVDFAGVHRTMDKYIMYRTLGGRLEPGAPIAYISDGGRVRVE